MRIFANFVKNTDGQLGIQDEDLIFDPKIIDNSNAPWQISIDTQIIFGKNSRGYVFQCNFFKKTNKIIRKIEINPKKIEILPRMTWL